MPPRTAPRFLPWIGPDYTRAPIAGLRILILGESHYSGPWYDGPDADVTRFVVRDVIAGHHRGPFFRNVRHVMGEPLPWADFWNAVAFYNYIQEYVGTHARIRPKPEMWSDAADPLRHVLDTHRPDFVLVCGSTLWRHVRAIPAPTTDLEYTPPHTRCRGWTVNGTISCVAGMIQHPSYPRFRRTDWLAPVATYLRRAARPLVCQTDHS